MTSNYASIDISADPALLALAEDVRRTNRPRVLRRENEDIAVITPVHDVARPSSRGSAAGTAKYPTVASLAGAAGSLPASTQWEVVRESARDEHLDAKFRPHT